MERRVKTHTETKSSSNDNKIFYHVQLTCTHKQVRQVTLQSDPHAEVLKAPIVHHCMRSRGRGSGCGRRPSQECLEVPIGHQCAAGEGEVGDGAGALAPS